ncbi:tryptophan synthase subunit alpha [Thiolapillus brandeum]|uniref:Tryptophan synthase alpha chain n=1 Tax=Thiolapillus brandeum TaxID=1076588 RepID=A0A7U6GID7_9GAMM|nr:tryptophan synthase subunit alpha [Thiolapillus brandeum]BAO44216.1 tryptophan synthase alpha chain [Thiolapillus brandeum]
MSRITQRFNDLQSRGRTALIPFITAGDPHPDITVGLMHDLVEGGADLIELGVPFSDPMADGPVIQRASERALAHHVSLGDVMDMVKAFRQDDPDTPVILMGYLNPVEVMGYETFAQRAAEAGVDGALTVDVPPEEGHDLIQALRGQGLDAIYLAAPTSHRQRLEMIAEAATGFIYYVSLKGVTGSANLVLDDVARKLAEIRDVTNMPLGVGFGIKDAPMAAAMANIADAVVVGSALVSRVEANASKPDKIGAELKQLLQEMRTAMDAL